MKVAFIGTHGVGKTTLCYDLAAALKKRDLSVELVREVARECPLPINRETTLKAQAWILHTQIAWELQAEAKADVVFCDRAVLDNYCYMKRAFAGAPEGRIDRRRGGRLGEARGDLDRLRVGDRAVLEVVHDLGEAPGPGGGPG